MNKNSFRPKRRKIRTSFWVISIVLLIYCVTLMTPLYYMLVNSFKRVDDFLQRGPWKFPKKFQFENYVDAITLASGKVTFLGMYVNSFVLTIGAMLINTATTTMTAYALGRFNFYGRDFLVALGVGALVIPDLGSGTVIYKLFVDLNWIDTWMVLIRYTSAFGLPFLILYGLFKTIAGTYVEAARIDGAGEWRIFLQICVPMAKGALGSIMVILFINNWNDYYTPYLYMPGLKTLSIGLQELTYTVSQLDKPKLFAGMVIAVTPLLVLFIAMREKIIENTVSGGLKG